MTDVVRATLIALSLTYIAKLGEDTQEKEGIIFLPFAHLYNLGWIC